MSINKCDLCLRKKSSSQAPKARFGWRQFLSRKCECLDRKSTAPNRLGLCLAHSITMSECEGSNHHLERRGKLWAAPSSWIQCQEAMDYACAPPREKTRLNQMTISNTLTVRSGRLLTTSSSRWTRLYMSAHSYAVAFHCILINTCLNQKRMSLLITQDKRTQHGSRSRAIHYFSFFNILLIYSFLLVCQRITPGSWWRKSGMFKELISMSDWFGCKS